MKSGRSVIAGLQLGTFLHSSPKYCYEAQRLGNAGSPSNPRHSYAQQLALVFAAAAILATLVVLLGGRVKRESGWRIIAGLLSVHAACLIVSTSLIVHEYRTDDRFYFGSSLGAFPFPFLILRS